MDKLATSENNATGNLHKPLVVPRFSLQINGSFINEDFAAGELYLLNESENTKLLMRAFQPFHCTLWFARKMAEILNCCVFINGTKDDDRYCELPMFAEMVEENEA